MIANGLEYPNTDVEVRPVRGGLEVETQDLLNEIGTGTAISSPADTVDVRVVFEGDDVSWRAAELDQLANAPQFAPIAVADLPPVGLDAYYAASSTTRDSQLNLSRSEFSSEKADTEKVDLTLTRIGTQKKVVRTLKPAPYMADHEFGNDLGALVALPADARKVRWLDRDTDERELADPVDTVATAYGDADVYDLEGALGFEFDAEDPPDAPLLVYEISKDQDANSDVRLWDTRGYESLEVDGQRQWQHVFSKDHEFDGEIVVDNGLLRLWIDEDDGTVDAQEWDDSTEEWTDLGLAEDQPADVELFDVDVQSIGMVRDRVQLTLDVSDLDTERDLDLFALDLILSNGRDDVLVTIPDGEEGPIPDDLQDWLEAIASESLVDAQPSKTLISRSEVRK